MTPQNIEASQMPTIITREFNGKEINLSLDEEKLWISASDIGTALEYAEPSPSVAKLFKQHQDEFDNDSTRIVVSTFPETGALPIRTREFSIEGLILLCMFSDMPKAKEFRRWAKKILTEVSITGHYEEEQLILPESEIRKELLEIKSAIQGQQEAISSILKTISNMFKDIQKRLPTGFQISESPLSELDRAVEKARVLPKPTMRIACFFENYKKRVPDPVELSKKLLVSTHLLYAYQRVAREGNKDWIRRMAEGKLGASIAYGYIRSNNRKAKMGFA